MLSGSEHLSWRSSTQRKISMNFVRWAWSREHFVIMLLYIYYIIYIYCYIFSLENHYLKLKNCRACWTVCTWPSRQTSNSAFEPTRQRSRAAPKCNRRPANPVDTETWNMPNIPKHNKWCCCEFFCSCLLQVLCSLKRAYVVAKSVSKCAQFMCKLQHKSRFGCSRSILNDSNIFKHFKTKPAKKRLTDSSSARPNKSEKPNSSSWWPQKTQRLNQTTQWMPQRLEKIKMYYEITWNYYDIDWICCHILSVAIDSIANSKGLAIESQ